MLYARYVHTEQWCGTEVQKKAINRLLKVGERYPVNMIHMGACYTCVFLNEGAFSSIFFEFEDEDGTPYDISQDPKYNPYLFEEVE